MKIPEFNLKCPAGPQTRRCSRAMAHRRGLWQGKVTLGILGVLSLGLLLAGSVFVSNQTTGLRTSIADLDSHREFLEAESGKLLTQWNAATSTKVITRRARRELGLVEQIDPGLVLVCGDDRGKDHGNGLWRRFLDRFGGGPAAYAADSQVGQVVGSMISLTPRDAQAAEIVTGGQP